MREKSIKKRGECVEKPKTTIVVDVVQTQLTPQQIINKEQYMKYGRKKYEANKQQHLEQARKYKQENKDKINAHRREYLKKKLQENPTLRLTRNMKTLLAAKIKKTCPSTTYLGTNVASIKQWLEYNFTEEMNWENYGSYWHIDHTIAVKQFDLNDPNEVKLCFNWKNLLPYEKSKNITKATNLYPHRVLFLEMMLRKFIKLHNIDDDFDDYIEQYSRKFKNLLPEYYFMQHTQIAGKP